MKLGLVPQKHEIDIQCTSYLCFHLPVNALNFLFFYSNVEKVWSESEETKKIKKAGLQKETEYWMKKILTKSEQEKIFGKTSDDQHERMEDINEIADDDDDDENNSDLQTSSIHVDCDNRSLPITAPMKEKETEINLQSLPQIPAKLPEKQALSNRIILTLPNHLLSRDISISIGNKMTKIKPKLKHRDITETVVRESLNTKEKDISLKGDHGKEPEAESVKGGNSDTTNTNEEQNTPSNAPSTSESVINTDDNSSNSTEISQSEDVICSNEDKIMPCIIDVSSIKQEIVSTDVLHIIQENSQSDTEGVEQNSQPDTEGVKENSQFIGMKGESQPEEAKESSHSEGVMSVNNQKGITNVLGKNNLTELLFIVYFFEFEAKCETFIKLRLAG